MKRGTWKAEFLAPIFLFVFVGAEAGVFTPPPRVVTLAPSLTSIVIAAGGAGHLVGVSYFSRIPEGLHISPKRVGTFVAPDIEKVISLKPDLVFASTEGNPPHVVPALERAGIKVVVISVSRLEDVIRWIKKVGMMLGTEELAEREVLRLKKILSLRRCSERRAGVFIETKPFMVAGSGVFLSDLLEKAGLKNAFSYWRGYFYLDAEKLREILPEIVILPEDADPQPVREVLPGAKVLSIPAEELLQPGPGVFEALEKIKRWCRGEGF